MEVWKSFRRDRAHLRSHLVKLYRLVDAQREVALLGKLRRTDVQRHVHVVDRVEFLAIDDVGRFVVDHVVGGDEQVEMVVVVRGKADLVARLIVEVAQEQRRLVGVSTTKLVRNALEHQQVGPVAELVVVAQGQTVADQVVVGQSAEVKQDVRYAVGIDLADIESLRLIQVYREFVAEEHKRHGCILRLLFAERHALDRLYGLRTLRGAGRRLVALHFGLLFLASEEQELRRGQRVLIDHWLHLRFFGTLHGRLCAKSLPRLAHEVGILLVALLSETQVLLLRLLLKLVEAVGEGELLLGCCHLHGVEFARHGYEVRVAFLRDQVLVAELLLDVGDIFPGQLRDAVAAGRRELLDRALSWLLDRDALFALLVEQFHLPP